MQHHGLTLIVTLTSKILSGLYLGNRKGRKLILGRNIG